MMNRSYFAMIVGSAACTGLLVLAAGNGCSSSDTTGAPPAGGGSGGADGSAGGTDGSAGGTDGSVGGAGGSAGGATGGAGGSAGGATGGAGGSGGSAGSGNSKSGSVLVGQTAGKISGISFGSYFATASFTDSQGSSSDCTATTVGACAVAACTIATPPDGGADGGIPTLLNAGEITVAGGVDSLDLTVDASTGGYKLVSGTKALFVGGETLTYTAAGGDVPAFNGTVTAPKTLSLSAPALPTAGSALDIPIAAPPTFTWTNGDSDVYLSFFDGATSGTSHSAICKFAGADGTATIPSDALKDFALGNANAGWSLSSQASNSVTAGDWSVTLLATTTGNDTAGALTTGLANYK